jgi:serine/threonine protein phosphatase PrpC
MLVLPGAVILSAADGHGSDSCPYSQAGSAAAVNVFCKTLAAYMERYTDDSDALMTFLNREGDTSVARAIDSEWKRRVEKTHRKHKYSVPTTAAGEIDRPAIWRQYGTTLLGLAATPSFYFAFQIGDGDILQLTESGAEYAVRGEKMPGTETRSLSHADAWKKAITTVRRHPPGNAPCALMMVTDGFANSYTSDAAFLQTCSAYYAALCEHGAETVKRRLKNWLDETSSQGCGDDVTALFAWYD